ncbi:hypothetical protein FACS1894139_13110 [Planctomycetales bacterium]|nr:hypothetical protein FACS1894107_05120 [Planctomycetales bacterium]GHS99883.1 hypothetical protein FACS1894108_10730 [Planctomycetales bacterium]GHT06684.1 hypothetical protein FACS1894139_13110 [Planctomycetales bacterium]GHV20419.1 hypothetical protein AGMMS49959_07720 [Planctomycetales bacterium]
MTKNEIALKITDEMNGLVPAQQVKEIVQRTLDEIVAVLVKEKRLELRNFGVFEVRRRKARKARNPKTGEKVYLEEHNVVMFSAGKIMSEKVGGIIRTTKNPPVGAKK